MKHSIPADIESALLKELASGSVKAFDQLYGRFYEAVRANILKIVRSEEAADDLLQDVFISLWEKKEKFRDYERIGGWLFVASYNRSINYLKRLATEKLNLQSLGIILQNRDRDDEIIEQEKQLRIIEQAIAQLPPQRKKVFELCRFGGLTYEQTAQELSISKNTVKDHLARASESILEFLQSHPEGKNLIPLIILSFSCAGTTLFTDSVVFS